MYKEQKIVVEDALVSKSCPEVKKLFTGGASVLQLPVTVSFMDKGRYSVHISDGMIHVIMEESEEEKSQQRRKYYIDAFSQALTTVKEPFAPPERYYEYRKGAHEDIITETYVVGYEPLKLLDFSYSKNENRLLVPTARKNHFEKHGVADKYATANLYAYTVPPSWYDAEVKKFEEMQEEEDEDE